MNHKVYYICKYTPVELLAGFGARCILLDKMPDNFDHADELMHPNVCGFGKSIIEAVISMNIKELVLVNCCDSIRSTYEALKELKLLDFLYFMDLTHDESRCGKAHMKYELEKLAHAYGRYSGNQFDISEFYKAAEGLKSDTEDYIGIIGARVGKAMEDIIIDKMPLPVRNLTCVRGRSLSIPAKDSFNELLEAYSEALLSQLPCMRMNDITGRKKLFNDPNLKGIIYSTVKFCDYYGLEYAQMTRSTSVPFLKLETDYTLQALGQLETRLDAFSERLGISKAGKAEKANFINTENKMTGEYFAGIDSGSASTDVVIMDKDKNIVSEVIIPTGPGAGISGEKALNEALKKAGLEERDIACVVTTGYGRNTLSTGNKSITEISCHAKGAFYLDPDVRTIIDIGGQDSKAIRIDNKGNVVNFTMNDKCAAGTGRFLEIMAHTLLLTPQQMSVTGLTFSESITISNMCTVFAESEIVSLIAQNKSVDDIVHGLNMSIASKVKSLTDRVNPVPNYMMTGGVAKNKGVVKALEERLGTKITVNSHAQVCGAIGAALYAMEL